MKHSLILFLVIILCFSLFSCGVRYSSGDRYTSENLPEKETADIVSSVPEEKTAGTETANITDESEEEEETPAETSEEPDEIVPEEPTSENNGGIRPEFKEALDSYEKFFDEYCAFLTKYNENPADWTLLAQYASYMTQYATTMQKMDALDDGEMNEAESLYYIEVTTRINQKLLQVSATLD